MRPLLAGCLGLGVLALLGFPPFSLFASELGIVRAGFAAGLGWVTAARPRPGPGDRRRRCSAHASRMLLGPAPAAVEGEPRRALPRAGPDRARRHRDRLPNGAWQLLPHRYHGEAASPPEAPGYGLLPVLAALAACAVLGVSAGPLTTLLHAAAQTAVTP